MKNLSIDELVVCNIRDTAVFRLWGCEFTSRH